MKYPGWPWASATGGVRILDDTVGQWYADFPQTSDNEVRRLLAAAWIQ